MADDVIDRRLRDPLLEAAAAAVLRAAVAAAVVERIDPVHHPRPHDEPDFERQPGSRAVELVRGAVVATVTEELS
jgi:hypothetical protein